MLTRVSQLLLVALFVPSTPDTVNDPFIVKWNVNLSRSEPIDQMKIQAASHNSYIITFGPGAVDTVMADGIDHPALMGTTFSMAGNGPNRWRVVRKKGGRTMLVANWTLSADGKTLADEFNFFPPDSSPIRLHYVYERTTGGSGITDTWVAASEGATSATELQIRSYRGDGLSFDSRAAQITKNIKFDGKDYPDTGPNAVPGSTSSGRRVNERSLEITDKTKGKVIATRKIELSQDLRTLTIIVRPVDPSKPKTTLVFDRI